MRGAYAITIWNRGSFIRSNDSGDSGIYSFLVSWLSSFSLLKLLKLLIELRASTSAVPLYRHYDTSFFQFSSSFKNISIF